MKLESLRYPEVVSSDHWGRFVDACLTGCSTTANFDYSGPLTEAVLLGGVACRFPKTALRWDSAAMRFDLNEANDVVRRPYRDGWSVQALA